MFGRKRYVTVSMVDLLERCQRDRFVRKEEDSHECKSVARKVAEKASRIAKAAASLFA